MIVSNLLLASACVFAVDAGYARPDDLVSDEPGPGTPDGSETAGDASQDDLFNDGLETLVQERNRLSRRMFRLGLGLDRYLSGRDAELIELNESYARIRSGATLRQEEGLSFEQDVKFRLDVPTARQKYRIIFENDVRESAFGPQGVQSDVGPGTLNRENLSAAVSLAARGFAEWDSSFNVGVRGTLPLDPFVRHSLKREWDAGAGWKGYYRSRTSYFNSIGYGYDTDLRMERMLDPDLGFSFSSRVDWSQEEDYLQMSQVFAATRFLDDKHLLDHSFGFFTQGLGHTRINNYFLALTHRSVLYQDWFIMDLIPQIDWDRERDFDSSLSFTLRFEVLFFEQNPFD